MWRFNFCRSGKSRKQTAVLFTALSKCHTIHFGIMFLPQKCRHSKRRLCISTVLSGILLQHRRLGTCPFPAVCLGVKPSVPPSHLYPVFRLHIQYTSCIVLTSIFVIAAMLCFRISKTWQQIAFSSKYYDLYLQPIDICLSFDIQCVLLSSIFPHIAPFHIILCLIALPSVHGGVVASAAVSGDLPGGHALPQREAVYSARGHAVHRGRHNVDRVDPRRAGGASWHLLWSYSWGQL